MVCTANMCLLHAFRPQVLPCLYYSLEHHSLYPIPLSSSPLPFSCDKGIVALGFPRVSKQTQRIIRLKSALPKKSAPEALNPTLSQQTNTILVPTRYYLEDDDAHAKLSSSPVADDNKRGRA